jgi:septum formation protein
LASGSAARRGLLQQAGLIFDVIPADIDESAIKSKVAQDGLSAARAARVLAAAKAKMVSQAHPDCLVIGADQILVCNDIWFDKPKDLAEAGAHLRTLRGKTHALETSICVCRDGALIWQHHETPLLTMRSFTDRFLQDYLDQERDALCTTVGAYRLEGLGIQLFDQIVGDQCAILGLPLLPLLQFLRHQNVLHD